MTKRNMKSKPLGWDWRYKPEFWFELSAFVGRVNEVIADIGGFHYEWASHYRMTPYMWRKFRKGIYNPGVSTILHICYDLRLNPYDFTIWRDYEPGRKPGHQEFTPDLQAKIRFNRILQKGEWYRGKND